MNDMMKYLEAKINTNAPLYEILIACHELVFENDRYDYEADISHLGIGWQIYYRDGDRIIGHTGITNQTSFFRFVEEKQIGVVVLTNILSNGQNNQNMHN